MSKIKLYGHNVLSAKIDAFAKRGANLQKEAHKLAMSTLSHLAEHSDIRMVARLVNAMPEMTRTNGLIAWFEAFGPVKYDTENKAFVFSARDSIDLDAANAKPFWLFKAQEGVEYTPLDLDKYLNQVIKRLEKDMEKTGRNHHNVLNTLHALVAPAPAVMQ